MVDSLKSSIDLESISIFTLVNEEELHSDGVFGSCLTMPDVRFEEFVVAVIVVEVEVVVIVELNDELGVAADVDSDSSNGSHLTWPPTPPTMASDTEFGA